MKKVQLFEQWQLHEGYIKLAIPTGTTLELWDQGNYLEVGRIQIPKELQSQGLGTQIMELVIKYADQHQKPVYLTPSLDFGATSKTRLTSFYKRLGFTPKPKHDFSNRNTMVYNPK